MFESYCLVRSLILIMKLALSGRCCSDIVPGPENTAPSPPLHLDATYCCGNNVIRVV